MKPATLGSGHLLTCVYSPGLVQGAWLSQAAFAEWQPGGGPLQLCLLSKVLGWSSGLPSSGLVLALAAASLLCGVGLHPFIHLSGHRVGLESLFPMLTSLGKEHRRQWPQSWLLLYFIIFPAVAMLWGKEGCCGVIRRRVSPSLLSRGPESSLLT